VFYDYCGCKRFSESLLPERKGAIEQKDFFLSTVKDGWLD
jgi:hypothetical protein